MTPTHDYLSTACAHGKCGSCRQSCKFCDAPCRHDCHPQDHANPGPVSWVDQARDIARALLAEIDYLPHKRRIIDPDLRDRIEKDPALFWLRDEEQPPGEWRPA